MEARATPQTPQGAARGYRALPAVPDELVDASGAIRPAWRRFIDHLNGLAPEELERRIARGDQYLRDSGVYFRQYGQGPGPAPSVERPWPLAPVPVLLSEAEWAELTAGLIQRADLLEALMRDLYGANRLVAEGHLPPRLIAENPEWLRPLVGVAPRGGHHLHFLAFELGRGPDGRWWVLADRAQAPSGAGFALENRVATSRVFSEIFAEAHVHRLAGFFRTFREALQGLAGQDGGRVAILSPGPMNETYFEHAYIARYLGFTLVQGEDLTVQDGRVMVRTVSGPRPLSVLWRRLDGSYADPLELDPRSRLGTPGLVSALRAGGVAMLNALGSGIVETRALMAFLPKLAPLVLGEPLRLPNIATWWCGERGARAEVQAAQARLVLSPAMATGLPFEGRQIGTLAAALSPSALADRLAAEGAALVAQEAVTLSTTPALVGQRLVPRPMVLRVYLARTPAGWAAMPGGFARIGAAPDPMAIAMQRGGAAADVWVVGESPVAPVSMVAAPVTGRNAVAPGGLPARAADNLFWLGRYVERTEGILRLLRARNLRLAETGPAAAPLLAAMQPLFDAAGTDPDQGIPEGLVATLAAAIAAAGQVRDRVSPDAWFALMDIDKTARRMAARVEPGDDAARALSALIRKLTGFSGLVHENMYRFLGWRFLGLGRRHERAMGMAALLLTLADPAAPPGALDLAIEVGDSVIAHRRRFTLATSRETVIDMLALDAMNPRSIRAQLDGLCDDIGHLPGADENGRLSPLARAALRLQTEVATAEAETLDGRALSDLRDGIAGLSDLLTGAYFR